MKMQNVPKKARILTSTLVMKKKADGAFCARIHGCGYEQVYGIHYYGSSINSPVTSGVSIRIVMILVLIARWDSKIVDIKGSVLNGDLDDS